MSTSPDRAETRPSAPSSENAGATIAPSGATIPARAPHKCAAGRPMSSARPPKKIAGRAAAGEGATAMGSRGVSLAFCALGRGVRVGAGAGSEIGGGIDIP